MNKTITITKPKWFRKRLDKVKFFVEIVKLIVDKMVQLGEISQNDKKSLCLADDTAAWICGRIKDCNFVTFRLQSHNFNRKSKILSKCNFDQTFEQQIFGSSWNNLIYMNYTFEEVAIKLIVYTESSDKHSIEYSNPCPQLSYFIYLNENVITHLPRLVTTRDCDCLRKIGQNKQYVDLVFDLEQPNIDNTYHKSLINQEDLIEETYDDNIIAIVCQCETT
ncbi:lef-12 [Erannis ankeraria nucleopolyhedrovirus]|uniref:lef-12 n=1 Tax=Erannis ankeraria nucleopolyhedrovirus TaxID=2913600 RepID=UPI00117BDAC3|nr:lef-12 [Erannis ankeraria nucleopolyhedrovirus]UJZ89059.1 lef-12 [Erannis ankeraria nucleopolyhedrovirus]